MKKNNCYITCFFYVTGLCCLLSCKKSEPYASPPPPDTLSFNYQGKHYDLANGQWFYNKILGLIIYRSGIFSGSINYTSNNCAYMNTDSLNYFNLNFSNCQLSAGLPVDSTALYLYQAGSQNITTKNCKNTTRFNIITFTNDAVTVCDMDGFFNLTIKNSQNKTIVITEGEFHKFEVVN